MTRRKQNISRVKAILANGEPGPERETWPVSDVTRAALLGMQLQAQTIQEAQSAINRAADAYNKQMQALGALAAAAENRDTKVYQLDVDRMVWVERKK